MDYADTFPDNDFMALARERFKLCADAESDSREQALDDFKFRVGEQWPDEIKAIREAQKLPCLTINRIPRTIAQVTNEQRQQRPSGNVNPVGDGADKETADVFQGIIRHIEVNSDADIAKDMAFDHMVTGGFGHIRLVTDYIDNESDDQEIYVRPIENAFSVYGDPYESVSRPADYKFIVQEIGPEEYKRTYPKSDLAGCSIDSWASIGNRAPGWVTKDSVRIAEYFWVEETEGKRKPIRKVWWTKINGLEELEKRTGWLVDEIPIFKVSGEEVIVDGKKHLAGLVRYAKDPARMYNVWVSSATTMIGMAPKPKYVAAAGQVENYKDHWDKANQSNIGVLVYDPIDVGGTALPAPQLQTFEPPIQAIQMMVKQADNDFKSTTGIYDASLGEKGPDESGKAILARQKQTDIAILNFSDNLSRTLLKMYRHMLKLIPKVYSTRQVLRIIKPDGSAEMVHVNDSPGEPKDPMNPLAGAKKVYDIQSGRYDVVVTVGPSYQTKRQESVTTQLELAKSFPIVASAAPDLILRNMDIPQADEIADRVKLLLPPPILQSMEQDQMPQLRSQLAHATTQLDLLTKVNGELLQKAQGHEAKAQADIQIEAMRQQTTMSKAELDAYVKITVAEITTKAQNAQTRAELESEELQNVHDSAHELALQAHQQMHERTMGAQDHAQTMEQGDQSHQQALEQGEQGHQQALEQGEQSGQQQQELAAQTAEQGEGE